MQVVSKSWKSQQIFPKSLQKRKMNVAFFDTLSLFISNFWLPELLDNKFVLFCASKFVVI